MQLDEELRELVLVEHGLQEALEEDVGQAAVKLLVLEHVEDPQDAFTRGIGPDDVLQLVCERVMEEESTTGQELEFKTLLSGLNTALAQPWSRNSTSCLVGLSQFTCSIR